MGKWKGVLIDAAQPFELYDLENDLAERHNVTGEHPKIATCIRAIMKTAHVPPPPQIEPDAPDGRQRR